MKKFFYFVFLLLYFFIFVFWIISFSSSYNAFIVNSPVSMGFSLSDRNIRGINTLLFLSILLITFHIIYSIKGKSYEIKKYLGCYVKYFAKYIFFLLEITVGIYVTSLVFSYDYINFNPKIVFILVGFILFYILEKAKEKVNTYLSCGTLSDL